jgi:predicted nucleic acid-binding protein
MASGPVVSNTTPLITLAGIDLLDLLPRLYGAIWIPEQVYLEYQAGALPADPALVAFPWLHIMPVVVDPPLLEMLNLGEAAAITLAVSTDARAILLDEKAGRRIAVQRHLAVVGSLGVLVRAKQAGLIPAVRPKIDMMLTQGRRVSAQLVLQTLRAADEAP